MMSQVARPIPLAAAVISATMSLYRIVFSLVSIQARGFRHHFNCLGLTRADRHTAGPAVLPRPETLPDPSRRANQRLKIYPFVGHSRGRLFLAMREVEFLDPVRGIAKSITNHNVFV